jgi:hypothetical protein
LVENKNRLSIWLARKVPVAHPKIAFMRVSRCDRRTNPKLIALHVRFGSKADSCSAQRHVCFGPIADISERLFQNHIGSSKQCRRYREPERFGSFQIYDQLIFCRPLHRQVCWFLTSEYAIDIARRMAILVGFIGSIGCFRAPAIAALPM